MERAVYSILERSGIWQIRLNGKDYGPCRSREHALDVAIRAATRAHQRGVHAHVMVRENFRFRSVWCDGRDLAQQAA